MKTIHPKPAHGFSFLELLIVLAIITILSALVFPVVSSSRQQAREKTCVSNMQQISHALSLYTADYDGVFPLITNGKIVDHYGDLEAQYWGDSLQSYLHHVSFPTCPDREWPAIAPAQAQTLSEFSGYALNAHLNYSLGNKDNFHEIGYKDADISHPSCTIALLDVRTGIYAASQPDTVTLFEQLVQNFGFRLDPKLFTTWSRQVPGASRHHEGANYSFADGHVKWLKPEQIRTDIKSDGVHPGFGL